MATDKQANTSSASTTWVWKKTKLKEPRREGQHSSAKPRRFGGLSRRDRSRRLTLTISYKGGSEAWWLVEARGRTAVFPGHRALHDVMREVNKDF